MTVRAFGLLSSCVVAAMQSGCHARPVNGPAPSAQSTCADHDTLACIGKQSLPPYIAAPGRIRLVIDQVPAGVALPSAFAHYTERSAIYVVDVTPGGRDLFAIGVCPTGANEQSELEAVAQDTNGGLHVICIEAVLGGEPGQFQTWRPQSFEIYEGIVQPDGGVIDWRPVIHLPGKVNEHQVDRVDVLSFDVPPTGPSVIALELETTGVKAYNLLGTAKVALDHRSSDAVVVLDPPVDSSRVDAHEAREVYPTMPANLKLDIDWRAIATVDDGSHRVASWPLPNTTPTRALATCSSAGCVGAFVFDFSGTSAIVVKRSAR